MNDPAEAGQFQLKCAPFVPSRRANSRHFGGFIFLEN